MCIFVQKLDYIQRLFIINILRDDDFRDSGWIPSRDLKWRVRVRQPHRRGKVQGDSVPLWREIVENSLPGQTWFTQAQPWETASLKSIPQGSKNSAAKIPEVHLSWIARWSQVLNPREYFEVHWWALWVKAIGRDLLWHSHCRPRSSDAWCNQTAARAGVCAQRYHAAWLLLGRRQGVPDRFHQCHAVSRPVRVHSLRINWLRNPWNIIDNVLNQRAQQEDPISKGRPRELGIPPFRLLGAIRLSLVRLVRRN